GARVAGDGARLTARLGRVCDIAREAAFVAEARGGGPVTAEDVQAAVVRGRDRASRPVRRFHQYIVDGTITVALDGMTVGQVNGLATMTAGPLTYGFPQRITASVGPGSLGLVNVEYEADLSGAIHTKGFHILRGLLHHLLRLERPLALDASIVFEQSYGGVDGDSASGAEACCILSALTDTPLRQDLAMTGAIDQRGSIMAVGAVSEKIDGFHDACAARGLTGTQGVIIPRANVSDLTLRPDVVEACRAGRFRVYAVDRIEEALSLLTGEAVPASAPGAVPAAGTLLHRARAAAQRLWLASLHPAAIDQAAAVKPSPPSADDRTD
ncbi:MAG: S16 family serine protease, partial [Planctomycetota bacterium]